jgi:Tfp pilus assembly protein PilN
MLPLAIDFLRDARAPSVAGVAILLAGALGAATSVSWYAAVSDDVQRLEAQADEMRRLTRRTPARMKESPRDALEMQREVRIANQVVARMTLPWDRLFSGLEAAADGDVALLALQPDAAAHQVRISGEAKSFKAMLDYSRRLEQTGTLGGVVLLGHEIKSQDPQRPVAFSVSANWNEQL